MQTLYCFPVRMGNTPVHIFIWHPISRLTQVQLPTSAPEETLKRRQAFLSFSKGGNTPGQERLFSVSQVTEYSYAVHCD